LAGSRRRMSARRQSGGKDCRSASGYSSSLGNDR
jgi:hypothetical protein